MTLNPGPFNVKEHALLMVMCSMSFGGSYASTIYGSQKYIYNQDFGFGFKILIVWSTQLLGLSLASLTRRFLVWPSSMIWPSNLPYCAMLNSLHGISTSEGDVLGKGRFKFFLAGVWGNVPLPVFSHVYLHHTECGKLVLPNRTRQCAP